MRLAGMRVAGMRVAGMRVAGMRVAGMRVAGVDGCPGGWICALVSIPPIPPRPGQASTYGGVAAVEWRILTSASPLRGLAPRVGIDIPIGLPWGTVVRAADGAARARLPGRASSVFPTPVRAVLGASTYAEACSVSRAACGRAISKQTWFITPKIAEVDSILVPGDESWLAEVHPEVSFAAMAGSVGPPKKTPAGRQFREAATAHWLGWPVAEVVALVSAVPRPARADDALDALACAWSALRWATGKQLQLGDPLARDERGLPMRILV